MTDAATVSDCDMDAVDPAGRAPDSPPDGAPDARRTRLMRTVKLLIVVVIAVAIGWAVVKQWPEVRETWVSLSWSALVLATLAALAALATMAMAWRAALADIEHRVTVPAAARISLIGQLGKYIPGSVWMYMLQMELGRRAGLPRARAFLASVIATGLGVTAALAVGLLAVPKLLDPPPEAAPYLGSIRVGLITMVVLAPIAVFCTVPQVLTYLVRTVLRLLHRAPLTTPLSWPGVLRVVGWNVVTWFFFGLHLWLLARTGAPGLAGLSGYLLCTGAFAVAQTIGQFALTPSGVGIREGALVAVLVPFFPHGHGGLAAAGIAVGSALGIALASRLILIIADVSGAGLAALTDWRWLRRRRTAREPVQS